MHRPAIVSAALTSTLLLAGACARHEPSPAAAAPFAMTLEVKQLMNWVMDPHADIVFAAVATIITAQGEEKIVPQTDADWNNVRSSAAVILESGNLLMLPGRARQEGDWNETARALSAAAERALQATDVKDPDALFDAAGAIYEACTACHARYIFEETSATARR